MHRASLGSIKVTKADYQIMGVQWPHEHMSLLTSGASGYAETIFSTLSTVSCPPKTAYCSAHAARTFSAHGRSTISLVPTTASIAAARIVASVDDRSPVDSAKVFESEDVNGDCRSCGETTHAESHLPSRREGRTWGGALAWRSRCCPGYDQSGSGAGLIPKVLPLTKSLAAVEASLSTVHSPSQCDLHTSSK
jgi:hypothetical protein